MLTLEVDADEEPFLSIQFSHRGQRIVGAGMNMAALQLESFPWDSEAYSWGEGEEWSVAIRRYADAYWVDRWRKESAPYEGPLLPAAEQRYPLEHEVTLRRPSSATVHQLDLKEHYNFPLHFHFFPPGTAFDDDNDFRELPKGFVRMAGVDFDLRGVVQLRARSPMNRIFDEIWKAWPEKIHGVKVGHEVDRLHVLHATAYPGGDGAAIAAFVLHYVDGQERMIDVVYGRDVRNWWQAPGTREATANGRVVWTGTNPTAADANRELRLYLTSYENPRPDVDVTSVDYVSRETGSGPFLIALTTQP
jgi:hypothetical protein